MDLLFLGHRDAKTTLVLFAAFFRATKNTAQPKPGGTERRTTRIKPETFRKPIASSNERIKLWFSAG
jgi:hypothetical protein